jgi:hypothetical protein
MAVAIFFNHMVKKKIDYSHQQKYNLFNPLGWVGLVFLF